MPTAAQSEDGMNHLPRRLILAAGFVLGVTFLWIALRNTNVGEIRAALGRANYALVLPFLGTIAFLYWLRAVRWSVLLEPLDEEVTAREVFPAVMIGFASNIVLPPPLSEFVRMFIIGRQLNLKNTSVLTTIVLERVFDLLTIVSMLGLALLAAPKTSHYLTAAGYMGGAVATAVTLMVLIYVMWTERFLAILDRFFSLFPGPIERMLSTQAAHVASGLEVLKSKRRILRVATLTVTLWTVMALGIYISLVALHIVVHPSMAFVVLAFTFVGITLPTTPGAVGTIQLSFTLALAPAGVAAGDAVAASIFWHAIAYLFVVSVGFFYFLRLGHTMAEIRRHARAAEAAALDDRDQTN
jgi:uncharacterized protein (TIRG00374 family)